MKRATTIPEQIKLLRNRGVQINNEAKAKENLLDIGYYRLGFYFFPWVRHLNCVIGFISLGA